METNQTSPTTIDQYITGFPEDIQAILQKIRAVIQAAAPDAQEAISYAMPTFKLEGNLIHFAAFKNHIGLYPTPHGIEMFKEELSAYAGAKGSIRFPLDQPIPYDLIGKIAAARVQDNLAKAAAKKKK